jgi:hypothetical protein
MPKLPKSPASALRKRAGGGENRGGSLGQSIGRTMERCIASPHARREFLPCRHDLSTQGSLIGSAAGCLST